MHTDNAEFVADPVSHISISGVHGRDELNRRLASAPEFRPAESPLKPLLVGVALGAVLMALLQRR